MLFVWHTFHTGSDFTRDDYCCIFTLKDKTYLEAFVFSNIIFAPNGLFLLVGSCSKLDEHLAVKYFISCYLEIFSNPLLGSCSFPTFSSKGV